MTQGAVLFVYAGTFNKIDFICGHGWRNVLLLDVRIQSDIRERLLKRHRRIGHCYWCQASREISKNTIH